MRRSGLCGLALFSLLGCQGIPPEIMTGQAYQAEAWANLKANVRTIVTAYDKELRASYDKQLEAYFADKIKASLPESVPADYAIATYKAVMDRRAVIYAELDQKREQFLNDPNIQIGAETSAVLGQYLRSTQEGYDRVRALIGLTKGAGK